ncbi:hypothetical protein [Streptomyces sp. 142MFCol3.1]|uniref:hypothetical protein n=1 Tax=Streptomyces sp. 142MFCol3.1 TaxID=1172179 RepID=UPI00041B77BA|nr:hypothetical protein [Streptomyces sp. 142MFCol3.1]
MASPDDRGAGRTTGAAGGSELADLRARVAELERKGGPTTSRHRLRSLVAGLLILLTFVLTPLSAVAAWARSEVADTDRYVATVKPLASDPDVQAAVADRVTEAVMQHIDLQTLLESVAPEDRPRLSAALEKLSGPLTSGLTGFVHSTAEKFVDSDAFATLWTDLNRRAHAAVDKALTGSGGGAVKLTDDSVVIDLAPVIDQVKQALVDKGLTVASKIPEVHTDFTVLTSDSVGKAQKGYRLLQLAGFWLPVLTLVLAAAAVLTAVRRRRALVAVAIAVALGAAVLGVGLWIGRALYLDELPAKVSQPAAGAVYDALVRYLRTTVRMLITLGVVVALAAWLTGTGRAASRVRSAWTAGIGAVREATGFEAGSVGTRVHRSKRWLNWTVVAVAAATLLAWNYPTAAVTLWIALGALLALALVEFLDDPPESGGLELAGSG